MGDAADSAACGAKGWFDVEEGDEDVEWFIGVRRFDGHARVGYLLYV